MIFIKQPNTLIIMLLALSMSAAAQYTGTNPNVAGLKKAFASDSVPGFEPGLAVDNLPGTMSSIPNGPPSWFMIDLGTFHYIDGYGMNLPNAGELPLTFALEGSADAAEWFPLSSGTSVTAGTIGFDLLNPDVYRYVRMNITAKHALATMAEFYVYGYELLPPGAPLAMAATNRTSSGFTANWGPISSATGYRLKVATDIDFTNLVSGYEDFYVGNVFSKIVVGLSHATTYYFSVKAENSAGMSAGSNKIAVTTLKQVQTITFDPLTDVVYGDTTFELAATASSGLLVSYSSSVDSIATVNGSTVTIVGVGSTGITASQAGGPEYEAATPVEQELVVNKKALTVTGVAAEDKVYDGLTDAVLSGGSLNGIVGVDVVSLADATSGTFAQTGVGSAIAVTTSMTLSGVNASNYTLIQPAGVTAAITAKELSVTGASAPDKVYDGTTAASLTGASLVGIIGADLVNLVNANSGIFAQPDVGTGIAVASSMSLGGADADNYTLVQPTDITGTITKKDLTVTPDGKSREACGPNPVFTLAYSGFAGTEDASVLVTEPVAFSTADEASAPGSYDITASGGDGGNYKLVFIAGTLTVTPDVTDPLLSVQNITVQIDETGNASIKPSDVVLSASDNCGILDTTISQSAFTSANVGEVVVNVTLTDAAGNTATEFTVVTVEGTIGIGNLSRLEASVYPNPTNGRLELLLNAPADGLKVMDMTGKTVIRRSELKTRETLDLSGNSNGVYILQIKMGEDLKHIKLIKK